MHQFRSISRGTRCVTHPRKPSPQQSKYSGAHLEALALALAFKYFKSTIFGSRSGHRVNECGDPRHQSGGMAVIPNLCP